MAKKPSHMSRVVFYTSEPNLRRLNREARTAGERFLSRYLSKREDKIGKSPVITEALKDKDGEE